MEYGPTIDVASGIGVQGPLRENVAVIVEKWASLEALRAHLQAPHMAEYRVRVKDLVVGSGISFSDRGARELKGVPGEWRLYAVDSIEAADLRGRVDMLSYRLHDGLAGLADGGVDALVWSGGVPTPAISELDAKVPLRMLDISPLAAPMAEISGYPYLVRQVPTGDYVPPGLRSIGVPNLLLCRHDIGADVVAAVVDVLATDAPQLVPPYVRGLQYLDPPSMIQTGLAPLHPGAVSAYQRLHG